MRVTIFLLFIIWTSYSYNQLCAQDNKITDDRDGQMYKIVLIGEQTWMARNLNYETESSFWFKDKKKYGKKHGRLYTWIDAKNACPSGWRLPTDKEWIELIEYHGGGKNAGLELKADGTSGFDVFFSGFRDSIGTFYDLGHDANFWTSSSVGKYEAWRCYFDRGYTEVVQDYFSKAGGLSVRCIKD